MGPYGKMLQKPVTQKTKLVSKEQDMDHFGIYHVPGEDKLLEEEDRTDGTRRTLCKTAWAGRNFISDNFSVPWGFELNSGEI